MGIGWFFIALADPFLSAITNFIDKYLTEHLKKRESPVQVLLLYSTLFSILVLPGVYLWNGGLDAIGVSSALVLIVAGVLEVVAVALYLTALLRDEASIVVPLFQLIPVFSFIFGFFILGEVLTAWQIFSGCIIIAGSVVLTLEFSEESRIQLKKKLLFLMLGACAAYALFGVLFKYEGSAPGTFWTAVFWQHVGILCAGAILFTFFSSHRREFVDQFKTSGWKILGLNGLNEALYAIGIMCLSFAVLLAPAAMVMTVVAYQPVFVLMGGVLLTLCFPRFISENISPRHLIHKGIGIAIVVVGSILLLR